MNFQSISVGEDGNIYLSNMTYEPFVGYVSGQVINVIVQLNSDLEIT